MNQYNLKGPILALSKALVDVLFKKKNLSTCNVPEIHISNTYFHIFQ